MNPTHLPKLQPGQRHPDWMHLYDRTPEENLPWHLDQLDPDYARELSREFSPRQNTLLDLGTGLGRQAMLMSQIGFKVTGTEISVVAVQRAAEKYSEVRFLVDDARRTTVQSKFDYITDRGCFHVLEAVEHAGYIDSVKKLLKPRGVFLLKTFSSEMGRADVGPIRFSLPALHYIFSSQFEIIKIRRTLFYGSMPTPQAAWFLVMKGKDE